MARYDFSTQKELFEIAYAILEDYNIDEWSFGGGTALSYCYYEHRMSYDIDIFLENYFSIETLVKNQKEIANHFNILIHLVSFYPYGSENYSNIEQLMNKEVTENFNLPLDKYDEYPNAITFIAFEKNGYKFKLNFTYSSSLTSTPYVCGDVFGLKNIKIDSPIEIIAKILNYSTKLSVENFIDLVFSEKKDKTITKLYAIETIKFSKIDNLEKEFNEFNETEFNQKLDFLNIEFVKTKYEFSSFISLKELSQDLKFNSAFEDEILCEDEFKYFDKMGFYEVDIRKKLNNKWEVYLSVDSYQIKVLSLDLELDCLIMYPFISIKNKSTFLSQKYDIQSITLEGFGILLSEKIEEIDFLLKTPSPTGIYKTIEYGYGLKRQYHSILEFIPCKHLIISKISETKIENDKYILNYDDYEKLRKSIDRISDKYQQEVKEEKNLLTYNFLLNNIASQKYPKKYKKYKKDTISQVLLSQSRRNTIISNQDKKAVINIIKSNTKDIYNVDKVEVLKLIQDVELIGLEELIKKIESKIDANKNEDYWQKLFNDNPFILSLAFSFPVIKIGEQISVGGRNISGDGGKITDFLFKNKLTDNIAIIEIKKPHSQLLQKSEYRGGLYAPDKELSGSINQILDQKFHFQQEFAQIMFNSEMSNTKNYYINCLLIIGKIPEERDKKKSFELFRNNSKDIIIVTFDELLDRLKNLYSFLSEE